MPTAHARNSAASYFFGNYQTLILTDGNGRDAIERALLPMSAGAAGGNHRTDRRDPFAEPDRALRLTLASDVADDLPWLLGLARLPQVTLDLAPGLEAASSTSVGRLTITERDDVIDVHTTRQADTSSPAPFRRENSESLAQRLGLELLEAQAFALSLAAHQALGNDYLVSPTLASHRATNAFWGRRAGVCTVEEALFLAGLKGRLYRMLPIDFSGSLWITTGWLYDAMATTLSPALRAALAGALAAQQGSDAAQCVDHLLTIRSRLRDLLISRDEVARLERCEVLGKDWPASGDSRRPVLGGSGNDLIVRVQYHVTAALNAFAAILDNLAWLVAIREGIVAEPMTISFERLVRPKKPFGPTCASAVVGHGLADKGPFRRALALRSLRNALDHRVGPTLGWVRSISGQARVGPELLAVWVPFEDPRYLLPGSGQRSAALELLDYATHVTDELVVLRPRILIEAAISSALDVAAQLIKLYEWGSSDWLGASDPQGRNGLVLELCSDPWQRALWRLPDLET